MKLNSKLLTLKLLAISHAAAEGECDPQLNKTRLVNYEEHKFNYAGTAVRSDVYILRDTHMFCQYRAVKREEGS